MLKQQIQIGLLGGQERDLRVLGELHKRPGVAIRFVYDPDPQAVAMEIAEILGLPRIHDVSALAAIDGLDAVVVAEPRERFAGEIAVLRQSGAEIVGDDDALVRFAGKRPAEAAGKERAPDEDGLQYSVDDALRAFERLFDRDQLLESLLDVAVEATGATAGSIMMYSAEAEELYIAYATGLSDRVTRNTRVRLGDGIAGSVARERSGRVIRDRSASGLYAAERDRPRIDSAVSVPLVIDERLLGVMNVSSDEGGRALGNAELATLAQLAGRIANVLDESLKLEESRIRHREMTLRLSVGELSERNIDANRKFRIIANFLSDIVGADGVEVFIGTGEGEWLVLGGSNRRLSSSPERVRCDRGALSRAYLERRTVILSEPENPSLPDSLLSSFAFVPLHLGGPLGVLMVEFDDRRRLDDFLRIKDSVTLELSRFVASERRERALRRELDAMAKVSDTAPSLLACGSLDELAERTAQLAAGALECDRVSVRLAPPASRGSAEDGEPLIARFEDAAERDPGWKQEDDERFITLRTRGETFSLAIQNHGLDPDDPAGGHAYHSVLAVPVRDGENICGGVIAYDRRPRTALEDATFTDVDRNVLEHIVHIVEPIVEALRDGTRTGAAGREAGARSYETILSANLQRLKQVVDAEMGRADRYHHSFSVLLLRLPVLDDAFDASRERALEISDEVSRGIATRTRKTDFGAWIRRDTFAMVSLEGSRRIRFLIARLILYLRKDLQAIADDDAPVKILVGHCVYPSAAKTPEAILSEAEGALEPWSDA